MKHGAVALVTGAGSGIGAGIVSKLAKTGFTVIVADIDAQSASLTALQLMEAGYLARSLVMDVSQPDSIEAGFASIEARYGRCDVLVNNAGIAKANTLENCTLDDWNNTLAVNVTSAMLCSQWAAQSMRKLGWGRIINISSISGLCASSQRLAYGTSKAALIGLTKQIAIELAQWGITVNAIAPGAIETPLAQRFHTPATRENFLRRIPAARYGQVADIAAAVNYLVSDEANYVNGLVLTVDGGFMATGLLTQRTPC